MKCFRPLAPLGAVLGLASAATAQHQYAAFNPSPSHVSDTWRTQFFSAAPERSYSRWLVVADWNSDGAGTQSSRQAAITLSSVAGSGTGASPEYPGTFGSLVQYGFGSFPFNSSPTTVSRTIFWTGSLAVPPHPETGEPNPFRGGAQPLFLNFRQTTAGANANWSNVRVVLDPNIVDDRQYTYLPKPAAFTDLGTLAVGQTSISQPVSSTAAQVSTWFRFRLDRDVPFQGAASFDIFKTGTDNNVPYYLFKNSSNGLVRFDSQTSSGGVLSYGAEDPFSFGRPYGTDYFFFGRGGGLTSLSPTGLSASDEYFLLVGGIGTNVFDVNAGANSILDADGVTVHQVGTVTTTMTSGSPAGDSVFNIRSIPGPAPASLLIPTLLASRRRARHGR